MNFSIVIPVYNEEKNITNLVNEIVFKNSNYNFIYEIIIVNDSSIDKTKEQILKLKKKI